MVVPLHNFHASFQSGNIQRGRALADAASIHLDNHASGDAPRRQPPVVGIGAVSQCGVVRENLARLQNGAIDLGKGQGHVAVAVGCVGGNRAVAGKPGKMLLQIGFRQGWLRLNKSGLNIPAPLLGEQLAHAFQRLHQVHLAALLLIREGEAVLVPAGNCGVFGLGHAILGGGEHLLLPRL